MKVPIEGSLREDLEAIDSASEAAAKVSRAKELFRAHWLSSLQVKAIAARLPDDNSRLDFALAAYPRTLDPENFYEVYDAFTAYSKVFRLHDRIQSMRRPYPADQAPRQLVSPEDLKEILNSLRQEPFEQARIKLAKQVFSVSKREFLSGQVRQILGTFDFEPSRLEIAKFAFAYTADPEKYFLVNEAFSFNRSKEELAKFIQSAERAKTTK
jgi:hypothetical protein